MAKGGRLILFVDHATGIGGAEQSLLVLLKHLNRALWQPHLACPEGALGEKASLVADGVHIRTMPRLRRSLKAFGDWVGTALELARVARRIKAALMVTNTVRATTYGSLASYLARVPLVWYMHDFWLSESRPKRVWIDRGFKAILCRSAKLVITNSRATAEHLPCSPKKVKVIYNGVEVERFVEFEDQSTLRISYNVPLDAPLVGMVGRLRPWKGQDRFLRVFRRVLQFIPEAHALVVGGTPFGPEGDYPQYLLRLAHELGVAGKVTFTDQIEDVRPALAAMDVFVHPGDPEPFGFVNIEAMAMAKPVVAFRHGALPEIVLDGQTGILVPPYDEEAMAKAIVQLLEDAQHRVRLGEAGRRRVQSQFTAQQMTAAFEEALLSCLD